MGRNRILSNNNIMDSNYHIRNKKSKTIMNFINKNYEDLNEKTNNYKIVNYNNVSKYKNYDLFFDVVNGYSMLNTGRNIDCDNPQCVEGNLNKKGSFHHLKNKNKYFLYNAFESGYNRPDCDLNLCKNQCDNVLDVPINLKDGIYSFQYVENKKENKKGCECNPELEKEVIDLCYLEKNVLYPKSKMIPIIDNKLKLGENVKAGTECKVQNACRDVPIANCNTCELNENKQDTYKYYFPGYNQIVNITSKDKYKDNREYFTEYALNPKYGCFDITKTNNSNINIPSINNIEINNNRVDVDFVDNDYISIHDSDSDSDGDIDVKKTNPNDSNDSNDPNKIWIQQKNKDGHKYYLNINTNQISWTRPRGFTKVMDDTSDNKSTSDKSTTDKSTSDKSTSDKSTSDRSTSDRSTSNQSSNSHYNTNKNITSSSSNSLKMSSTQRFNKRKFNMKFN